MSLRRDWILSATLMQLSSGHCKRYAIAMNVTWSIKIRQKSPKLYFDDLRQTEAGDFSIKFFRYRSTTIQRAERALAGCWAISEELNREVNRFSLPRIVELQLSRLISHFVMSGHISEETVHACRCAVSCWQQAVIESTFVTRSNKIRIMYVVKAVIRAFETGYSG